MTNISENKVSELHKAVDELRSLEDNWDADGEAPRPTDDAIARAHAVIDWAESEDLIDIEIDVDPDAMGGVAVNMYGKQGQNAWISCPNEGNDTVLLSVQKKSEVYPWDRASKKLTMIYLFPERVPWQGCN